MNDTDEPRYCPNGSGYSSGVCPSSRPHHLGGFCVLPSLQHCACSSGEAIVSNERGLAVFDLIRRKRHGEDAVLIVFDLIKLEGEDLRRMPEQRKRGVIDLAKGGHFPE